MAGRAMLTCDIDERWNGPPPRCEPIECEELPDTYENAKVLTPDGIRLGAKAEIVCIDGFKPDGPKFITCLATGQWSSSLSQCIQGKKETLKIMNFNLIMVKFTFYFQMKKL